MPGPALCVVSNARAGTATREAVDTAVATLRDAGADVTVAPCEDPGDLAAIAVTAGDRTVVVAGGDGSLHEMVAALRAAGLLDPDDPLALLPMGTGNDFARCVGLPLDPVDAARALLTARPRRLDLLLDDSDGVVVNAAHVGVGAEAAQRAADLKPRLGAAAYPLGSVVAGATTRGWRLRVTVDDRVLADGDEPLLLVGIGNGTTIGGGTALTPDAVPDDGLADVVVAATAGPLARLGFAVDLARGAHDDRGDVLTARGRRVVVTGEPAPVNADGEVSPPVARREWQVLPAAWSLLVPSVP